MSTKNGTAKKSKGSTKKAAPKAATVKEPKAAKAPKEPKAKKEKAPKEQKPFKHDPRVLPYVGENLEHTERDGTVHLCRVLEDGFEVDGVHYNSATAAAKPLQPKNEDGQTRAVNGLVYWNIVKAPRAAVTPEAALDGAAKAVDRAVVKSAVAIEAAGDKKGEVRRALAGAVKKFEKLLEQAAA